MFLESDIPNWPSSISYQFPIKINAKQIHTVEEKLCMIMPRFRVQIEFILYALKYMKGGNVPCICSTFDVYSDYPELLEPLCLE